MGWQSREGRRQLKKMVSCGRLQSTNGFVCSLFPSLVVAYECFVCVLWENFCDDFFLLCFVALMNQEIML